MSRPPVRIRAGASLQQAAEVVALSSASDLMVVDADGAFVGVLSEGDILRQALPDSAALAEIGGTLEQAFSSFVARARALSALSIDPFVIEEPLVAEPNDHVAKVAALLIDRQIRRLPVVEQGRVVGTISRADICRALVGAL